MSDSQLFGNIRPGGGIASAVAVLLAVLPTTATHVGAAQGAHGLG